MLVSFCLFSCESPSTVDVENMPNDIVIEDKSGNSIDKNSIKDGRIELTEDQLTPEFKALLREDPKTTE